MRIYIIRHAEPDYANNTITPAGHLEAQALAAKLVKAGIDEIYSSPMGRALHTMSYSSHALKLDHIVEPWLAELSGWKVKDWQGGKTVAWNIDGEVIRGEKQVPTTENWHERPYFNQPEFYTQFQELKQSSDLFLQSKGYKRVDGKYEIVEPNRRKIAVFCHHGFGLAWLAHLLELPLSMVWAGFWLPPSSVTTVLFDERSDKWAVPRCVGLGDVSHLWLAGIPVSSSGIVSNFE